MIERGRFGDQPWGMVVGALGRTRWSGEVIATIPDDREYRLVFVEGWLVAASSPLLGDTDLHVAIALGLVPPSHIERIHRRMLQSDDAAQVIAEECNLRDSALAFLRQSALAQRARRTFAIVRGDYRIRTFTNPAPPECRVDIRPLIYQAARSMSEPRLVAQVAELGEHFLLHVDRAHLDKFGFTEIEAPVLDALAAGATLDGLRTTFPRLPREVLPAILYTLACCGMFATVRRDVLRTATRARPRSTSSTTYRLTNGDALSRRRLQRQLVERFAATADHFAFLGVPFDASAESARLAYARIVQILHAGRSTVDPAHQTLINHAAEALRVVVDPRLRAKYIAGLHKDVGLARGTDYSVDKKAQLARGVIAESNRNRSELSTVIFFDVAGHSVAHSDDGVHVFAVDGRPLAYLDGDSIYTYGGEHLGWWDRGWMRDHLGACVLFTRAADAHGPPLPAITYGPAEIVKMAVPAKRSQELRPVRVANQVRWSLMPGTSFFLPRGPR